MTQQAKTGTYHFAQRPDEFERFIGHVKRLGVRSYLEIGVKFGGSLKGVGAALPRGGKVVGVDLPGGEWGTHEIGAAKEAMGAVLRDLDTIGIAGTIVLGNSHDEKVRAKVAEMAPFDMVFIDGDHTLAGVTRDFFDYGPLARIVAFHDIDARAATKASAARVGVPELWATLKAQHRDCEFVEIVGEARGMGIGIMVKP